MAGMSRRLLDHVDKNPPHRDPPAVGIFAGAQYIERRGSARDLARLRAHVSILLQNRLDRVGGAQTKRTVVVPGRIYGRACEGLLEPTHFGSRKMRDDAKRRQARRCHLARRVPEREPLDLAFDNTPVPIEEPEQHVALVGTTTKIRHSETLRRGRPFRILADRRTSVEKRRPAVCAPSRRFYALTRAMFLLR